MKIRQRQTFHPSFLLLLGLLAILALTSCDVERTEADQTTTFSFSLSDDNAKSLRVAIQDPEESYQMTLTQTEGKGYIRCDGVTWTNGQTEEVDSLPSNMELSYGLWTLRVEILDEADETLYTSTSTEGEDIAFSVSEEGIVVKTPGAGASFQNNTLSMKVRHITDGKLKFNYSNGAHSDAVWYWSEDSVTWQEWTSTTTFDAGKYYWVKVNYGEGQMTEYTEAFCAFMGQNVGISFESCFLEGTLVRLPDGSTKAIEEVALGDNLLTYDFYEGKLVSNVACILERTAELTSKNIITISTSGGKTVSFADIQSFFDADRRVYFDIDVENYKTMVGRHIAVLDGDGLSTETISSISLSVKDVRCYDLITAKAFNFFAGDILSIYPGDSLVFPYEIGEDFKVDEEAMARDTETYGLFTAEDFSPTTSREVFDAMGMAHYKVLIGKGLLDMDIIESLRFYRTHFVESLY